MSRPSQNIDKKLIELGKKKTIESGIAGLSIRSICIDSGINLGMFYYHFKTKENFIKIVFKSLNEDHMRYLEQQIAGAATPVEKLKICFMKNAKMMVEKRGMFESLLRDVGFEEFFKELMLEIREMWKNFFYSIIDECKKDGSLDSSVDTGLLLDVFTGTINSRLRNLAFGKERAAASIDAEIEKTIDFLMERFK
ncbi:MAG: TetR/AcrR family transcriptional regulator, partial [Endomicrobia bacterium]|nr:TetR/AcrR family transcriptional regulator [Endomicrobiia bacterium]